MDPYGSETVRVSAQMDFFVFIFNNLFIEVFKFTRKTVVKSDQHGNGAAKLASVQTGIFKMFGTPTYTVTFSVNLTLRVYKCYRPGSVPFRPPGGPRT